ncbi:polysaccharide pyruvyl transferase family protein [Sphingomonas sp. 28-63-12]|uniref:polysaccharide pyruvyl transferase family protein n=1 Tax=Sphingomonas sp. 28-63-12 TaxID=1970434 RepID=UPI000BCE12DD|nr:MAG: hypothetical protein B7Y47_13910 [Sphingomonas sp. 28-63-12]
MTEPAMAHGIEPILTARNWLAAIAPWWTQGEQAGNFGDWLVPMLVNRALVAPVFPAETYWLLGSTIDEALVRRSVEQLRLDGGRVAYWGCGARSATALSPALMDRAAFFGVRGPLSRDALGLPMNTPLGDPGFLLPLLYAALDHPQTRGRSLCVPHFAEPMGPDRLRGLVSADVVLAPVVTAEIDVERMVDAIASADFVLAGSLHAAIIACAYGRPFAFMDCGFVDVPFKWHDLAALLGIEARFVDNVAEGREWYEQVSSRIRRPKLLPLTMCCPWTVRASVIVGAAALDCHQQGQDLADAKTLREVISAVEQQSGFVAMVREGGAHHYSNVKKQWRAGYQQGVHDVDDRLAALKAEWTAGHLQVIGRLAALRFRFAQDATLGFTQGSAGAAMLEGNWSPANEIGPVSCGQGCAIVLEAASEWHDLAELHLECWIFAPHQMPFSGERTVRVNLNDTQTYIHTWRNTGDNESIQAILRLPLPDMLVQRGGPLRIEFHFDVHASPHQMGLRHDLREVGIVPLRLWGTMRYSSSQDE